jgi:hypothetical protein
MEFVDYDKRSTSISIDAILERLETFSNAKHVHLKCRVFNETLTNIKAFIAHDIYEYNRVSKKEHSYRSSYDIVMIDYLREEEGVRTLRVTKFQM